MTLDDATGCLYSAILVDEEGTMSSFLGLQETIAAHGLFGSFYTDRGSHYFFTPKAGQKVDRTRLTQVGRATEHAGERLRQLGIRHIPSYSSLSAPKHVKIRRRFARKSKVEVRVASRFAGDARTERPYARAG